MGCRACCPQTSAAEPLRQALGRFETSPITGIHLWFDRQITDLEHAVLLDRTIQWMFHKSKLLENTRGGTAQTKNGGNAEDSANQQLRRAGGEFLEDAGGEIESRRLSILRLRNLENFSLG